MSPAKSLGPVVVLTSIPAPYRIPVFNRLNQLLGGRITVLFTTTSWRHRSWTLPADQMNFNWRFLAKHAPGPDLRSQVKTGAGMLGFLIRSRPEAVISGGYDHLAAWVSFAWCKVFGRRFILWMESNARDQRSPSKIKTWMKRLIVSKSDAIASPGKATIEYARMLGADERRISIVRNGFDVEFFAREAAKVDREQEKKLHRYPPLLLLFAGRLVRIKGVFVLLEAFRRVSVKVPDVGLLIVGHGADQEAMKDFCRKNELERVYFEGSQPYERMPYYYGLADVMVLPTFSDPHPLSVGEALACGTAAIVSRAAGSCDDLVREGETGFAVQPGDSEELTEKILQLLRDSGLRTRMARNCRALIQGHTAEHTAQGLFEAALGRDNGIPRVAGPSHVQTLSLHK